jgi:hypothetical protein
VERVKGTCGQPSPSAYDHVHDPSTDTSQTPVGRDGSYNYSTTALMVFWPEIEYGKLIARWPHLVAALGATWDEHRRQAERHCAMVARTGHGVSQTPGDIAGFEAFLLDKAIKNPSSEDLIAYPDLRSHPTLVPWPPARTAACWCGSGRKYKQCCRSHGLGTLD